MIMPANNASGFVHYWAGKNPGCIGAIHSPSNRRSFYRWLPAAIDNDRFNVWSRGLKWSENAYIEHIEIARLSCAPILWLLVPDVVGDAIATLAEWDYWEPRLRKYNIRLAFAAQDGIEASQIPQSADVIFVGGSDQWKYTRIRDFVALGKPVHVGRVNGDRIWRLHDLGVTSCDGSGWFRGDQQQLAKLDRFLKFQAGELPHRNEGQYSLKLELATTPPISTVALTAPISLPPSYEKLSNKGIAVGDRACSYEKPQANQHQ